VTEKGFWSAILELSRETESCFVYFQSVLKVQTDVYILARPDLLGHS